MPGPARQCRRSGRTAWSISRLMTIRIWIPYCGSRIRRDAVDRRQRGRGPGSAAFQRLAQGDEQRQRIRPGLRCPDRASAVDFPHRSQKRRCTATTPGSRMVPSGTATPAHGPSSARTSISGSSSSPLKNAAINDGDISRVIRCSTRASSRWTSRPARASGTTSLTHHGVWDDDLLCAPILFDVVQNGRRIKALAQPTKQAFLFVLNRETGQPIWPIEERPVPQSTVPKERTSPTQPFPTKAGALRPPGRVGGRPD